jgi:hypothetical protein
LERSEHLADNVRPDVLTVPILALDKQMIAAFGGLDIDAAIADPARLQNLTTDCPDRSKFSASTNRLGDLCKKTRNSPIRAIGVIRGSPDP